MNLGRGLRSTLPVTAVLLVACGPIVPRATESAASATPIPSAAPIVALGLDVELHELAVEDRPCSTDLFNLGTEIVWAGYELVHQSCPDIWRYVPGSPAAELVFRRDNRDAVLGPIVGAHGAYAFLEPSHEGLRDMGWRLWYLERAGEKPVLLAQGKSSQQAAATLRSDQERIVWVTVDKPAAGPAATGDPAATSHLQVLRWSDPRATERAFTFTARDGQVWYPSLNGDELWYGTTLGDSVNSEQDDSRIEMLNLADEAPTPVALPGVGRVFNPAVNDDFIVYKRPDEGMSPLNWGTIAVVNRSSDRTVDVIENGDRPTIGNRFVTFDTITHDRLYAYDPEGGRLHTLLTMSGNGGVDGASIRDDLLSFVRYPVDGAATIWWAMLPQ